MWGEVVHPKGIEPLSLEPESSILSIELQVLDALTADTVVSPAPFAGQKYKKSLHNPNNFLFLCRSFCLLMLLFWNVYS